MKMLSHFCQRPLAKLFLLSLFFAVNGLGDETKKIGKGQFLSHRTDSLAFIKSQLLHNAFKDVISTELEKMKLDHVKFWKNYEAKFSAYFKPIEASLKEKFLVKDGSFKTKNRYRRILRQKRLTAKRSYGNLDKLIVSYSIKDATRLNSLRKGRSHNITVQAKVNRRNLHQLYLDFTKEKIKKNFDILFLTFHFDVNNILWSSVDVRSQDRFTDPIKSFWKDWFVKNSKETFKKVVIVNGQDQIKSLINDSVQSLWLRSYIYLDQREKNNLLKTSSFAINSNHLFLDTKTHRPLFYSEGNKKISSIEFQENTDLLSQLSTIIYQQPIDSFRKIMSSLESVPINTSQVEIVVNNASNILEIMELSQFITNEGIIYSIEATIAGYSGPMANMVLTHRAEKGEFNNFLINLNRRAFNRERIVEVTDDMQFNILKKPQEGGNQ